MTQQTRDRIAAAFDRELAQAPVPLGLRAQVLRDKVRDRSEIEPHRRERMGRRWSLGLRGVGSLVAVVLVVVLIATVLVGGRVWRDWTQFATHPAPAAGIDPAQLALLEAKPLQFPVVPPGATCPTGTQTTIGYGGGPYDVFGSGPVYGSEAGAWYVTAWGDYTSMKLFVESGTVGPVLIRARDLQTGTLLVFVGQSGVGKVVGMDTSPGHSRAPRVGQYLEAALDTAQPSEKTVGGLGVWKVLVGHRATQVSDLCVGFQVDGLNFSEVFFSFSRG
jgi:hypothetical protein